MLSIGKISLDGEGYYLAAVADGIDEYYRGVGEAPGWWAGTAADPLGLDGEVAAEDLRAVWGGLDPATGDRLGRFGGRTVAGFDLCFRAPKSVSLLAGLGDGDTAAAVREAHDLSVSAAFGYVEREAARSRVGKNGVAQIGVNGLVAAGFRHRTSRAGDPHLHTHMLVANMAEGVDGKWRTLDGRLLFQYARTAGFLYEAQLRHELTVRLGVEWEPADNGIADIAGTDPEVLDHFSTRRKQIEEHLDEVGFGSARAAELATLATRTAKDQTLDEMSMRQLWEARAAEIGFDQAALAHVVGRVPVRSADLEPDALFDHLLGDQGLTEQASSFGRRDVLRAIAEALPTGATVAQVEELADDLERQPEMVRLVGGDGPGLLSANVIRRTDGTILAAGNDEARWSTAELIGIEQQVVNRSVARANTTAGVVDEAVLAGVMARRPTLAVEQADMVTRLTSSGSGIDVVSAAAGTGKTYTLDAAREAWQASGYRVIGAALAGRAAQELESSAGISSSTLAMLQIDLDAGRVRFDDRTAIVIDEAAMAGTRALAPVLAAADQAGAKVVLVGDPHQLPEIDAGGVLIGLSRRLEPVELVENRRQRDEWERDALTELRSGDTDTAFGAYQDHGRVISAPTAIEVRQTMVADWWTHRAAGDTVAMLAVRRTDVDDLNGRARAYLVAAGEVFGPELVVDERPYQAGDNITCLRNDRRLGVCNGTRATIDSVDPTAGTLTINTVDQQVVLPAAYLDDGHIAHAYATTIHKAQGATFDRGLLLGTDELYRERGYVGMSRGRETNHLYLVGAAEIDDPAGHGPPPPTGDPIEAVQQALTYETDKRLAIDTGEPVAFLGIDELVAEKRQLTGLLGACPPNRRGDIASLTANRDHMTARLAPDIARYNELAHRRLRGLAVRREMATLRESINGRTERLDSIDSDLDLVRVADDEHQRFQNDHEADRTRLDTIEATLDRQIALRVQDQMQDPPDRYLNVIGPLPTDPDQQEVWKRGAAILEAHHLGADAADRHAPPSVADQERKADTLARLEVVSIQRHREPPGLDHDAGLGLDLF
ncbi:MAG: relaxase domain-containing protein [Hyphomicrobiales bacterium]|nr:relaxase domain-containing protein [Hyphomicrobiales bacterium]